MTGVRFPTGSDISLVTAASQPALQLTQCPVQLTVGPVSLSVKPPKREACHSRPSTADVRNS
jgi:hypothetical protein